MSLTTFLAKLTRRAAPAVAASGPPAALPQIAPSVEVIEYGKNPACQAAIEASQRISFDALPTDVPVNPVLKDALEAYKRSEIGWQIRYATWQLRVDAANRLGLTAYSDWEAAQLLSGRRPLRRCWAQERLWQPRDTTSILCEKSEANEASRWNQANESRGLSPEGRSGIPVNCCPEFEVAKEQWVTFGLPTGLRVPMSLGSVLRLDKAKSLQCDGKPLFDAFAVLAPQECWAAPTSKDPILFGVIGGPLNMAEKSFMHRFCFLARWE